MSNRIKASDYLFISALLHAREPKLLSREQAERILSSGSLEAAAHIAAECGYDEAALGEGGIENMISRRRHDVFCELEAMSPQKSLVSVFRLKYDYYNAKILIKAEALGIDPLPLMSRDGIYPPESLKDAYIKEEFSELPEDMKAPVREAKSAFAKVGDPQIPDIILDRAYLSAVYKAAGTSGSSFLRDYAELYTDGINLKSAVRIIRMGKGAELAEAVLSEHGRVPAGDIIECIKSCSPLAPLYSGSYLEAAALLGDEASQGGGLTAFEQAVQTSLSAFSSEASKTVYGDAVVVGYMHRFERELYAVRIILTGISAGLSPDDIRERLGDLYV